jgi:predicted ArsR family transcriptional regulator
VDPLDLIGGRELRSALLYVRGSAAPVTADEAAVALGVHRSVARGRLERLLSAGLVEVMFERRSGRSGPGAGRPAKLYSAAPETRALEFPSRRFPALVARLLDVLPADGREQALRAAGEEFGRELARAAALRPRASPEDGLERVCAAMRSLGFLATLERVDGDTALIRTPTCPLRSLVAERPEAASIDRGMWAGLVERGIRGMRAATVECETDGCLDAGEACSVVIRFSRRPTRVAPPSTGAPSRRS